MVTNELRPIPVGYSRLLPYMRSVMRMRIILVRQSKWESLSSSFSKVNENDNDSRSRGSRKPDFGRRGCPVFWLCRPMNYTQNGQSLPHYPKTVNLYHTEHRASIQAKAVLPHNILFSQTAEPMIVVRPREFSRFCLCFTAEKDAEN